MTNTILLPIWTKGDKDSELSLIKEAKRQLNTDVMVKPVVATQASSRVLAIGDRPDFLCDHAFVKDINNIESLKAALHWCITGEPDERVTTIEKWLSKMFNGKVVKKNEIN